MWSDFTKNIAVKVNILGIITICQIYLHFIVYEASLKREGVSNEIKGVKRPLFT